MNIWDDHFRLLRSLVPFLVLGFEELTFLTDVFFSCFRLPIVPDCPSMNDSFFRIVKICLIFFSRSYMGVYLSFTYNLMETSNIFYGFRREQKLELFFSIVKTGLLLSQNLHCLQGSSSFMPKPSSLLINTQFSSSIFLFIY